MVRPGMLHRFCILAALLILMPLVRPLEFLERRSVDFRFSIKRLINEPPLDDRLVIVDIDDYSLNLIKSRWPWNRRLMAEAVNSLTAAGAKTIGIDLMFLQESRDDPEQDKVLADAIRSAGNIILAAAPYVEGERMFTRIIQPCEPLSNAAEGTAFVACLPDDDNVIRKMMVFNPLIEKPSLAAGFPFWMAQLSQRGMSPAKDRFSISGEDFQSTAAAMPLDENGLLRINYHHRYRRLSIFDVIRYRADPDKIRDRVVIIGTATALTHDMHMTPLGLIPGIDLHAHTLSTLLDRSYLRYPSWWAEGLLLLAAGLAAILLIPRMSAWRGLAAVAGFVLLWYAAAAALVFTDTVLPVVRITSLLVALYVLLLADRYILTLRENVRLYREMAHKKRMEHEIDIARVIQQSMYPSVFPTLDGKLAVAARSRPARELGGDYFDFFTLDDPDAVGIVVADVSGKGLNAALVVSLLKGFFKALVRTEQSPVRILEETNRFVNTELFETTDGKVYVTVVCGIYNSRERSLRYSKAGHTPGMLMRSDGNLELADVPGVPCGMFTSSMMPCDFSEQTIIMKPGDLMIWYTDGLTEAMNTRGEMLGEETVREIVKNKAEAGACPLVTHLFEAVDHFCRGAGQHDDITVVAFGPSVPD